MDGDITIIMADMNEDVKEKDIKAFCHATQMVEAISYLHGSIIYAYPPTRK